MEQKLKLEHVKPGEKTGEVYVRDNKNLINEISMLRKHINEYMQCRITGILDIPKVQ